MSDVSDITTGYTPSSLLAAETTTVGTTQNTAVSSQTPQRGTLTCQSS